jgi:hypothetical protein
MLDGSPVHTIDPDELARLQYLLHRAREEAQQLTLDDRAPDASDRIDLALTEALKVLRVVEARSTVGGAE